MTFFRGSGSAVPGEAVDAAEVVPFTQEGAGAIRRWLHDKAAETVSVDDFGASATASGATNSEAFSDAVASHDTIHIPGVSYELGSSVNFGAASVVGSKDSTLTGKGISFAPADHFYDTKVTHLKINGTGTSGETGLTVAKAHRAIFDSVVAENFLQCASFSESWLTTVVNCRFPTTSGNFGVLVDNQSNGWTSIASSYGGTEVSKPTYGAYWRGSYSVVSFASDYEYAYDGLVMSNLANGGAEPRGNKSVCDYFEGNTDNDIVMGDQAHTDRLRGGMVAFTYHQAGATNVGIRVRYATDSLILFPRFATTFALTNVFLRADSRNTRFIPFPRQDLATTAEVIVEAGATVADETRQHGRATIATDGAGNGYVDITFTAPYDSSTGIPPIFVQAYNEGSDPATGPGTYSVNNVTVSGFRLRAHGARPSTNNTVFWRAGGL